MKCKMLVITCLIFILLFGTIVLLKAVNGEENTYMAKEVKNAIKYSQENMDKLEVYQNAQKRVDDQTDAIDKLKATYKKGDYTIDDPYVALNPYGENNLSAYIAFDVDKSVKFSYTVMAKSDSNYSFSYDNSDFNQGAIVIPVVGLYENYNNTVKITLEDKSGAKTTTKVKIKTGDSPSNYTKGSVNVEEIQKEGGITATKSQVEQMGSEEKAVDDATLTTKIKDEDILKSIDGFVLLEDYDVYDLDGNLRFSTNFGTGNNPLKTSDGLYLSTDDDGVMYELDFMGRINQYYVPPVSEVDGENLTFHHDAVVTDDGKYMYTLAGFYKLDELDESISDKYIRESMIFKYDRKTGKLVDVFDESEHFKDSLQNNRDAASELDPIHMNSIDYLASKNMLIVSSKQQSAIMGINARNGKLEWISKYPDAVADKNQKYLLDSSGDEDMVYTSGNHTAFIMNTDKYQTKGNDLYLSVFNNNHCLDQNGLPKFSKIGETNDCGETEAYSSMVIYHIDLMKKTIETEAEIIPDDNRWSTIRSLVYTDNISGYYEINYADKSAADGSQITHSDLYVVDEEGNVALTIGYDGLGNQYRTRLINEDEISQSLNENISALKN